MIQGVRGMTEEDTNAEADFPICIVGINRCDIETVLETLDKDTQNALYGIVWNTDIMDKIREKLRREIVPIYYDCLDRAIKGALKDIIGERDRKRSFLRGLKEYIKGEKRDER